MDLGVVVWVCEVVMDCNHTRQSPSPSLIIRRPQLVLPWSVVRESSLFILVASKKKLEPQRLRALIALAPSTYHHNPYLTHPASAVVFQALVTPPTPHKQLLRAYVAHLDGNTSSPSAHNVVRTGESAELPWSARQGGNFFATRCTLQGRYPIANE